MKHYVYALLDGTVPFYVGMSVNPAARLSQHQYRASREETKGRPVSAYIRRRRETDSQWHPSITILEEVDGKQHDRERHWIGVLREAGAPLTNATPRPFVMTPARRASYDARKARTVRPKRPTKSEARRLYWARLSPEEREAHGRAISEGKR